MDNVKILLFVLFFFFFHFDTAKSQTLEMVNIVNKSTISNSGTPKSIFTLKKEEINLSTSFAISTSTSITQNTTISVETSSITVINSFVNVRAGPSINYRLLGQMKEGEKANVRSKSVDGQWLQIVFRNESGWIFAEYVKLNIPPPTPTPVSINLISINPETGLSGQINEIDLKINSISDNINVTIQTQNQDIVLLDFKKIAKDTLQISLPPKYRGGDYEICIRLNESQKSCKVYKLVEPKIITSFSPQEMYLDNLYNMRIEGVNLGKPTKVEIGNIEAEIISNSVISSANSLSFKINPSTTIPSGQFSVSLIYSDSSRFIPTYTINIKDALSIKIEDWKPHDILRFPTQDVQLVITGNNVSKMGTLKIDDFSCKLNLNLGPTNDCIFKTEGNNLITITIKNYFLGLNTDQKSNGIIELISLDNKTVKTEVKVFNRITPWNSYTWVWLFIYFIFCILLFSFINWVFSILTFDKHKSNKTIPNIDTIVKYMLLTATPVLLSFFWSILVSNQAYVSTLFIVTLNSCLLLSSTLINLTFQKSKARYPIIIISSLV